MSSCEPSGVRRAVLAATALALVVAPVLVPGPAQASPAVSGFMQNRSFGTADGRDCAVSSGSSSLTEFSSEGPEQTGSAVGRGTMLNLVDGTDWVLWSASSRSTAHATRTRSSTDLAFSADLAAKVKAALGAGTACGPSAEASVNMSSTLRVSRASRMRFTFVTTGRAVVTVYLAPASSTGDVVFESHGPSSSTRRVRVKAGSYRVEVVASTSADLAARTRSGPAEAGSVQLGVRVEPTS